MSDSIQNTVLSHGLRVLSYAMPDVQGIALGLVVNVGSRDEHASQSGMAHAVEHMLFKGTETHDAAQLGRELDCLGGNFNAFTTRERSCLHAHVLHEDWQQALSLMCAMFLAPTMPESEWQRERQVIRAELAMTQDSPEEWIDDQHALYAFPDQAVGRPVLGSEACLDRWTAADLRAFHAQYYQPERMLLLASGQLDHQALCRFMETQHFPVSKRPVLARQKPRFSSAIRYFERDQEQVQLLWSVPLESFSKADKPKAWLANQLLGGCMSSWLFREVRERRGLAYGVASHFSMMSDAGLWTIACAVEPSRLPECVSVLKETLADCLQNMGQNNELAEAKRQLVIQLRMSMDSVESNMLRLAEAFDVDVCLPNTWIDAIEAVQVEDLRLWLQARWQQDAHWSLAGPSTGLQGLRDAAVLE